MSSRYRPRRVVSGRPSPRRPRGRGDDAARLWAAVLMLFAAGMLIAVLEGRSGASAGDHAGLLPAAPRGAARPSPVRQPPSAPGPAVEAGPRCEEEHARLREAQALIDDLLRRMRSERARQRSTPRRPVR